MIKIKISDEFSNTPGGRFISEGDYSGEAFRDNILLPKFEEAEKNGDKLLIDFDGCFGFATSFLEEAFGGLVRIYNKTKVFDRLEFISNDDETIPNAIKKYLFAAEKER